MKTTQWCLASALMIASLAVVPATAQIQGPGGIGRRSPVKQRPENPIKSPVTFQLFQRNDDGRANIPVSLSQEYEVVSAFVTGTPTDVPFRDGVFVGVPAGGPYNFVVNTRKKVADPPDPNPMNRSFSSSDEWQFNVGSIYVGDLWVLAGQSNMEGYGDLADTTPSNNRVVKLGMNGKWNQASEPLHWLVDSPDPVHSGDPKTREERSAKEHQGRPKGAGLGLPFATVLTTWTGVPIGLIPCAHGGTSMDQWSPALKDKGGASLYGSMIRQVKLAGGKVKGVLWYQGESDAGDEPSKVFAKKFAEFIAAVRADFGDPELPFYYVQIGRHVRAGSPNGWNVVQEAQRKMVKEIPNTAVISIIDLEVDDPIHIGTQGLKRAGVRLARIAVRELFGQAGGTTPTFDRISKGNGNTLVVRFRGVNRQTPQMTGFAQATPFGAFSEVPALGSLANLLNSPRQFQGGVGMGTMNSPQFGGLQPARRIGGFSIRAADGTEIPLIFEALVGGSREAVVLKLSGPVPKGANLWYGWGLDPYCNLTDTLDMAVPVFGPIPLDGLK